MRARTIVILGAGGVAAVLALVGTGQLAASAVGRAESKLGWTWPWDKDEDDTPCANHAWDQCGGKEWTGETCCPEQFSCQADTEFYSNCKQDECGNEAHDQCGGSFFFRGEECCPAGYQCKTVVPLVYKKCYRNDECPNQPWDQCGGQNWEGETCCPEQHTCVLQADGDYAQCKPEAEHDEWAAVQEQGAEIALMLKAEAQDEPNPDLRDRVEQWAAEAQAFAGRQVEKLKDAQGEAKADLAEGLVELQAKMSEVQAAAQARGEQFKESLPSLEFTKAQLGKWSQEASAQAKRWWVSTSEAVHDAWKTRHQRWADFQSGVVDLWEQCGDEQNGDPCTDDAHCCPGHQCYEQTACIKANPEVLAL